MTDRTASGTGVGTGRTVVSFHAHPDDEALLTGGTLAKAAAAGHRVVLVTATAGAAGLAAARFETGEELGRRRLV
ncbi:MAG TPA: PIG-L family deacetylase, partial [Candidatus Eisenbacteria bacterium]|nr:PIG-L family deacetylase [Candidatus Eisenbacteria bacterium]